MRDISYFGWLPTAEFLESANSLSVWNIYKSNFNFRHCYNFLLRFFKTGNTKIQHNFKINFRTLNNMEIIQVMLLIVIYEKLEWFR